MLKFTEFIKEGNYDEYSSSYDRTIPRDFFNESKLLKCMGFLALKILDYKLPEGIEIHIEESGEPFKIELWDTLLYVSNYPVTINGEEYLVGTSYNSKDNFPFFINTDDEGEIEIFDDNGEFTSDFIEYFTK